MKSCAACKPAATRALSEFLSISQRSDVFPIATPVLQRAANLWAEAYRRGYPRDGADLIIASTALEHQRMLVTGNTAHFAWIPGLTLADWRQP